MRLLGGQKPCEVSHGFERQGQQFLPARLDPVRLETFVTLLRFGLLGYNGW